MDHAKAVPMDEKDKADQRGLAVLIDARRIAEKKRGFIGITDRKANSSLIG